MKLSNNCPHWILFDLRRTIESLDGESVRVCVCVFCAFRKSKNNDKESDSRTTVGSVKWLITHKIQRSWKCHVLWPSNIFTKANISLDGTRKTTHFFTDLGMAGQSSPKRQIHSELQFIIYNLLNTLSSSDIPSLDGNIPMIRCVVFWKLNQWCLLLISIISPWYPHFRWQNPHDVHRSTHNSNKVIPGNNQTPLCHPSYIP
jgi:hypothetical protein